MRTSGKMSLANWGAVVTLVGLSGSFSFVQAASAPEIEWNEKAESRILARDELAKLASIFQPWQIKQVTWPSEAEITSSRVSVDGTLTDSCIGWLRKFAADQYVAPDLGGRLIAMKAWGLVRSQSDQKRLCDVFITRLKRDPYVIHIQESPADVVIAVADERLADTPRDDHRDFVFEIARAALRFEVLRPNPDLQDVHVSETTDNGVKRTKVTWVIDSVTYPKDGRRLLSTIKASEVGASHVVAETEGRLVVFRIRKVVKGPAMPDPYKERF